MLVLLIIFIITIPVMKHAVNVDLPRASNQQEQVKPETVRLSVDAEGHYFLERSPRGRRRPARPAAGRSRQNPAARPAHPWRPRRALRARGPGHGHRPAAGCARLVLLPSPSLECTPPPTASPRSQTTMTVPPPTPPHTQPPAKACGTGAPDPSGSGRRGAQQHPLARPAHPRHCPQRRRVPPADHAPGQVDTDEITTSQIGRLRTTGVRTQLCY
jgi:hypothetical protein